jgi:hypothetical protein
MSSETSSTEACSPRPEKVFTPEEALKALEKAKPGVFYAFTVEATVTRDVLVDTWIGTHGSR